MRDHDPMGEMHAASVGSVGGVAAGDGWAAVVRSLGSSFPLFLADAGIWTYPGREEIRLALADLAGDLASLRDRASIALESIGRAVPRPEYPLRFTATHDLDLRYLLPRVIESLRAIAAGCDRLLESFGSEETIGSSLAAREADLIRESKGAALGHLDVLEQLLSKERWPAPVADGASPVDR